MDRRKSRLPVSSSAKIARSKSVSQLHVPQHQQRHSSHAEIRKRSTSVIRTGETPTAAFRRRSPYGRIKKSEDEEVQTSKIKAFLRQKDPEIISIKPSSIKDFLRYTNYFLMELACRYTLTMENYKQELPRILQLLEYPTKLTQSFLKTINTPHSYPTILAIWSYLLDYVIMSKKGPDIDDLQAQKEQSALKYMGRQYKAYTEGVGNVQEINEDFKSERLKLYGLDVEAIESLRSSVKRQQDELTTLHKTKANLDMEIEKLREKQNTYRLAINSHKEEAHRIRKKTAGRKLKLENKLLETQSHLDTISAERQKLLSSISESGHTKEEVMQIITKIDDLQLSIQLDNERREHLTKLAYQLDLEQREINRKFLSLVYSINNKLETYSLVNTDARTLLLPTSGIFRIQFSQQVKYLGEELSIYEQKHVQMSEDLDTRISKKESALKTASEKVEALEGHLKKDENIHGKLQKIQDCLQSNIMDLREKERIMAANLDQARKDQPDLVPYVDGYKRATEKRDRLLVSKEQHHVKINSFMREANKKMIEASFKIQMQLDSTTKTLEAIRDKRALDLHAQIEAIAAATAKINQIKIDLLKDEDCRPFLD